MSGNLPGDRSPDSVERCHGHGSVHDALAPRRELGVRQRHRQRVSFGDPGTELSERSFPDTR
jgi:hypothetical protein